MEQHVDEPGKQNDTAERHLTLNRLTATNPDDHTQPDVRHGVGKRAVHRFKTRGFQLMRAILGIDIGVNLEIVFLPLRQGHHLQTGQVLMQVLVQG